MSILAQPTYRLLTSTELRSKNPAPSDAYGRMMYSKATVIPSTTSGSPNPSQYVQRSRSNISATHVLIGNRHNVAILLIPRNVGLVPQLLPRAESSSVLQLACQSSLPSVSSSSFSTADAVLERPRTLPPSGSALIQGRRRVSRLKRRSRILFLFSNDWSSQSTPQRHANHLFTVLYGVPLRPWNTWPRKRVRS